LIADKIASRTPLKNVELKTSVDPELIGGFTLEVEDKLWDASIARDLQDIRKQFLDNMFVQKI
jgi:F-type H+-transporting ATPase subunit delta